MTQLMTGQRYGLLLFTILFTFFIAQLVVAQSVVLQTISLDNNNNNNQELISRSNNYPINLSFTITSSSTTPNVTAGGYDVDTNTTIYMHFLTTIANNNDNQKEQQTYLPLQCQVVNPSSSSNSNIVTVETLDGCNMIDYSPLSSSFNKACQVTLHFVGVIPTVTTTVDLRCQSRQLIAPSPFVLTTTATAPTFVNNTTLVFPSSPVALSPYEFTIMAYNPQPIVNTNKGDISTTIRLFGADNLANAILSEDIVTLPYVTLLIEQIPQSNNDGNAVVCPLLSLTNLTLTTTSSISFGSSTTTTSTINLLASTSNVRVVAKQQQNNNCILQLTFSSVQQQQQQQQTQRILADITPTSITSQYFDIQLTTAVTSQSTSALLNNNNLRVVQYWSTNVVDNNKVVIAESFPLSLSTTTTTNLQYTAPTRQNPYQSHVNFILPDELNQVYDNIGLYVVDLTQNMVISEEYFLKSFEQTSSSQQQQQQSNFIVDYTTSTIPSAPWFDNVNVVSLKTNVANVVQQKGMIIKPQSSSTTTTTDPSFTAGQYHAVFDAYHFGTNTQRANEFVMVLCLSKSLSTTTTTTTTKPQQKCFVSNLFIPQSAVVNIAAVNADWSAGQIDVVPSIDPNPIVEQYDLIARFHAQLTQQGSGNPNLINTIFHPTDVFSLTLPNVADLANSIVNVADGWYVSTTTTVTTTTQSSSSSSNSLFLTLDLNKVGESGKDIIDLPIARRELSIDVSLAINDIKNNQNLNISTLSQYQPQLGYLRRNIWLKGNGVNNTAVLYVDLLNTQVSQQKQQQQQLLQLAESNEQSIPLTAIPFPFMCNAATPCQVEGAECNLTYNLCVYDGTTQSKQNSNYLITTPCTSCNPLGTESCTFTTFGGDGGDATCQCFAQSTGYWNSNEFCQISDGTPTEIDNKLNNVINTCDKFVVLSAARSETFGNNGRSDVIRTKTDVSNTFINSFKQCITNNGQFSIFEDDNGDNVCDCTCPGAAKTVLLSNVQDTSLEKCNFCPLTQQDCDVANTVGGNGSDISTTTATSLYTFDPTQCRCVWNSEGILAVSPTPTVGEEVEIPKVFLNVELTMQNTPEFTPITFSSVDVNNQQNIDVITTRLLSQPIGFVSTSNESNDLLSNINNFFQNALFKIQVVLNPNDVEQIEQSAEVVIQLFGRKANSNSDNSNDVLLFDTTKYPSLRRTVAQWYAQQYKVSTTTSTTTATDADNNNNNNNIPKFIETNALVFGLSSFINTDGISTNEIAAIRTFFTSSWSADDKIWFIVSYLSDSNSSSSSPQLQQQITTPLFPLPPQKCADYCLTPTQGGGGRCVNDMQTCQCITGWYGPRCEFKFFNENNNNSPRGVVSYKLNGNNNNQQQQQQQQQQINYLGPSKLLTGSLPHNNIDLVDNYPQLGSLTDNITWDNYEWKLYLPLTTNNNVININNFEQYNKVNIVLYYYPHITQYTFSQYGIVLLNITLDLPSTQQQIIDNAGYLHLPIPSTLFSSLSQNGYKQLQFVISAIIPPSSSSSPSQQQQEQQFVLLFKSEPFTFIQKCQLCGVSSKSSSISQFTQCNRYNTQCVCKTGFGGEDCTENEMLTTLTYFPREDVQTMTLLNHLTDGVIQRLQRQVVRELINKVIGETLQRGNAGVDQELLDLLNPSYSPSSNNNNKINYKRFFVAGDGAEYRRHSHIVFGLLIGGQVVVPSIIQPNVNNNNIVDVLNINNQINNNVDILLSNESLQFSSQNEDNDEDVNYFIIQQTGPTPTQQTLFDAWLKLQQTFKDTPLVQEPSDFSDNNNPPINLEDASLSATNPICTPRRDDTAKTCPQGRDPLIGDGDEQATPYCFSLFGGCNKDGTKKDNTKSSGAIIAAIIVPIIVVIGLFTMTIVVVIYCRKNEKACFKPPEKKNKKNGSSKKQSSAIGSGSGTDKSITGSSNYDPQSQTKVAVSITGGSNIGNTMKSKQTMMEMSSTTNSTTTTAVSVQSINNHVRIDDPLLENTEWEAYRADNGKVYYISTKSLTSVWKHPITGEGEADNNGW